MKVLMIKLVVAIVVLGLVGYFAMPYILLGMMSTATAKPFVIGIIAILSLTSVWVMWSVIKSLFVKFVTFVKSI